MRERFLIPNDASAPSSVPLREISDRAFEISVFEAAKRECEKRDLDPTITAVELTAPSADRGRDVVVRNYLLDSFFGLDIGQDGEPKSVFIECKLTSKRRLTLEHVAANVLQIEPVANSVFILVTNATLTPRAACLIERQCQRLKVQFLLIDAWNISLCLPQLVTTASENLVTQTGTAVSYQVLKNGYLKDEYTLHFLARVLPGVAVDTEIDLHSTRDWTGATSSDSLKTIRGGNLGCWSIDIAPKGLKTPRLITIAIKVGTDRKLHEIPIVSGDEIARLPLFASEMTTELSRIRSLISSHNLPRLVHIHGKAGSGKSRLLLELFDEAKMQGLACRFITMLPNGGVFISTSGFGERDKNSQQESTIAEFFERMSNMETGDRDELILIDDIHTASDPILQECLNFTFGSIEGVKLVLAGRSDPTFRRPDYEAFVRQISEHLKENQIIQIVLGEMSNDDIGTALDSIFSEETIGLQGLRDSRTKLRPIDLVHAVHSLLERNHVQWADEERLTLSVADDDATDYFSGDEVIGGILEFRYQHLSDTTFSKFSLSGFLELLAVIDEPHFSYHSISKLLSLTDVSEDLLSLWVDIDKSSERTVFRHSSLKDYLHSKFYSFDTNPNCSEILAFLSPYDFSISNEVRAAFAFSDGEHLVARKLVSEFAKRLKIVNNISSLELHEDDYPNLATLFAILQSSHHIPRILMHRCLVARAYLNSHHLAYALGFIDNLKIAGLVSSLPSYSSKDLTIAAVKQLMAHALINSGDTKTALALMHEVENILESYEKSKSARAIEFDMCDRLQSFYAAQSAFHAARLFFLRARSCAHFVAIPALLSLSFSAEFHLSRYLDVENAERLAERQLKHAEKGVPERTQYHAKVNSLVATWAVNDTVPDDLLTVDFQRLRVECQNKRFGHLVPRLDYILSIDSLIRWRNGEHSVSTVDVAITKANESARRYGYSEYVWLLASLDLIRHIEENTHQDSIIKKACWIVDHLHDQGLTFIAGDELCFQNTVVLSNALRAIHSNSDQETAWRYARKVSFSPLFIPKPSDQRRRIDSLFEGEMLNHVFDPKSIVRNSQGYAIILV